MQTRKVIALLVVSMFLTSLFCFYAFSPDLSYTTVIEEGSLNSEATYIMFRDGSTYYAKSGLTGAISYSGTNFTAVFEDTLDAIPAQGGKIHLKPAEYEGWLYIDRDGVIVEGEGTWCDTPTGIPDNSPTELYGTVIKVLNASQDAITITGQRYGVHIRDLGIWFNVSSTGSAITTFLNQTYTLTHSTIENIKVLNCDKDSYAIELANILHMHVRNIMAWGGPLLHLYANHPDFQQGNSVFDNMYGYIKYDLNPVDSSLGPFPIFISKNDTIPGGTPTWTNLLSMRRIQINNPTGCTDGDYYSFVAFDLRYSTLTDLDFEGSNCQNQTIQLGSCKWVTFQTLTCWEQDPSDSLVHVSSNNEYITFQGCFLEDVWDFNVTDAYINCAVINDIHANTVANFINLEGNSGYSSITNGQASKNVTATFLGSRSSIFLTIVEGDNLANGEALKVDQMAQTPANWFIVECIDGGVASTDIWFFWTVSNYYA